PTRRRILGGNDMGARVPQTVGMRPPIAAQVPAPLSHHFSSPSPLLSPFVTSLWIHRSAPHARSRVLPTGTAQLIVDLSGEGLSVPDLPDGPHPSSSAGCVRATRDTFPALLHGPDSLAFPLETERPLFQVGIDFKPGG